jgi:anti-anti-sigma regulatory factor
MPVVGRRSRYAGPVNERGDVSMAESQGGTQAQIFYFGLIAPVSTETFEDVFQSNDLETAFQGVHADHLRLVVFDFSKVTRLNSTGVGRLLTLLDIIRNKGGNLAFFNVSKQVNIVFDMMGITDIPMFTDLADFAKHLEKRSPMGGQG